MAFLSGLSSRTGRASATIRDPGVPEPGFSAMDPGSARLRRLSGVTKAKPSAGGLRHMRMSCPPEGRGNVRKPERKILYPVPPELPEPTPMTWPACGGRGLASCADLTALMRSTIGAGMGALRRAPMSMCMPMHS